MGKGKESKDKEKKSPVSKKANEASDSFRNVGMYILVAVIAVLVPFGLLLAHRTMKGSSSANPQQTTQTAATTNVPIGANAAGKPREVVAGCVDRHKQCPDFARNNACVDTPGLVRT